MKTNGFLNPHIFFEKISHKIGIKRLKLSLYCVSIHVYRAIMPGRYYAERGAGRWPECQISENDIILEKDRLKEE